MQDIIRINQADNVAVALRPIAKGETLSIGGNDVTAAEDIPQGHKWLNTDSVLALRRRILLPGSGFMCTM